MLRHVASSRWRLPRVLFRSPRWSSGVSDELSVTNASAIPPPAPTPDEESAPLAPLLRDLIRREGPMPLSRFMSLALHHPLHGYYAGTDRLREQIGRGGDFVTAPEISQTFGELLLVWCVDAWRRLGSPPRVRLVELGPRRGTLMRDMLKAARAFPDFEAALAVHMVEVPSRWGVPGRKGAELKERN